MMYIGNHAIGSYAIVVDNCVTPTASLLRRIRTREMMELSASRWDPTPAATSATLSPSSNQMEEQSFSSLLNKLGPKVPTRHISPPMQKRESPKQGRPNKPVRSRSPLVQARELEIIADYNSSESTMGSTDNDKDKSLPISPMLPSRCKRVPVHAAAATDGQQKPRMPERKSSLQFQSRCNQVLHQDEEEDNAMDGSIQLQPMIGTAAPEDALTPPLYVRQTSFTRQSSFEILPATLPTRQSSFELRHRAASPRSARVVTEILHHDLPSPVGASPRRSQSDTLPTSTYAEGMERYKMNMSLPNMHFGESDDDESDQDDQPKKEVRNRDGRRRGTARGLLKSDTVGKKKTGPVCSTPKITPHNKPNAEASICPNSPTPKLPMRQRSFQVRSNESSPCSTGSVNSSRFRRFRSGAGRPSLPVRNSSFEMGADADPHRSPEGQPPGRQNSFPSLRAAFRKL